MRGNVTQRVYDVRMFILDTAHGHAHGVTMMDNTIMISGAIDRADPDPGDATNPFRQHVGWCRVRWTDENGQARESLAALIRDSSSKHSSGTGWGASVLMLTWIGTTYPGGQRGGDTPPQAVVQATYDWLVDRGAVRGAFSVQLVAHGRSHTAPSYRRAAV